MEYFFEELVFSYNFFLIASINNGIIIQLLLFLFNKNSLFIGSTKTFVSDFIRHDDLLWEIELRLSVSPRDVASELRTRSYV